MKLLRAPFTLAVFLPFTLSAAIDPSLLNLVPPGTKILAGIQVQKALASPFGQYVLAKMARDANAQRFTAGTGFDLKRDLSEVLIASDGRAASGPRQGIVLLKGAFDANKLTALAIAAGAAPSNYAGVQLLISADSRQPTAAFLDSSTLVLGDPAHVKAAADLRQGLVKYSGALADKALAASNAYDAWFASVSPVSDFVNMPSNAPVPPTLLSAILEESGGVRFDSNTVNFTGEGITRTPQDAQAMVNMLQLVSAMIQSNKSAASQPGAQLLSSARIVNEGTTIRVTLNIPEQQLEQMLQPAPANRRVVQRR